MDDPNYSLDSPNYNADDPNNGIDGPNGPYHLEGGGPGAGAETYISAPLFSLPFLFLSIAHFLLNFN